ncbi:MAG: hypothetical protein M3323_11735 [Actinomycetota bacterium]|nr:hypothetical protein [Actinomycetota bacterium]
MTSARRRAAAAVIAALFVTGACSSPQGTEPENSLLGKDREGRGQSSGDKKGGGGKASQGDARLRVTPPPGADIDVPAPGESAAPESGAAKTETEVTSSGSAATSATVVVTEPDPDAEKSGLPPDYADILSTRIEGSPKSFRVTITFRGTLPDKMPDDKTYMVAGFGLTGSKRQSGYAFGAQADVDGWTPYGGNKDGGGGYPGTLSVQGATLVFTTPWSAIGGPRSFEWYSQGTWFRSLAGTTHYSFDNVPNEGPARYPAG